MQYCMHFMMPCSWINNTLINIIDLNIKNQITLKYLCARVGGFVYLHIHVCGSECTWRGKRTTCRNQFSSSTVCIQELELRSSTHWTNSLALNEFFKSIFLFLKLPILRLPRKQNKDNEYLGSFFCNYNNMPETGYILKKRGLFS